MRATRARLPIAAGLAIMVVLGACRGAVDPPVDVTETPQRSTSEAPRSNAPAPRSTSPITLAFAGDVHFEGGVAALLDESKATLGPLSKALASADVSMINLESALTTKSSRASKSLEDPENRYWFRTPPKALDILQRSGVDAVSVANNHGADYGASGLRGTLATAKKSKVGVLGVGANPAQAYRPFQRTVRGTKIAIFAADASKLESRSSIWNIGDSGPGLARADARLVSAVKQASATNDVVAVYLHWGDEGASCPTDGQRKLAQNLSTAGTDVIVGAHTHELLGAGTLGDSYVSYGLGNFLWYHGAQAATGVLQLRIQDGKVVKETWVPGVIPTEGGQPRALSGAKARDAVSDWRDLRGCTGLGALEPAAQVPSATSPAPTPTLPAYASAVRAVPTELRRRMEGSSHDAARCPVSLEDLRLLTLGYVDFSGRGQVGELIVHKDHADAIVRVFGDLYAARFPIQQMRLVDDYGGDDNASMAANNTSAYNCRTVAGQSTFSDHAYGAAVDINPVQNPYATAAGVLPPSGQKFVESDRSSATSPIRGLITDQGVVVKAFERVGWTWGGPWNEPDYQHFAAGN